MRVKRVALPIIAVIVAVTFAAFAGWLVTDNEVQAQTGLPTTPAPANAQVVNGDNPGEVVVSWGAVSGASGYSIRWVDNDAAWDAHYAGQDWQNLILSFDIEGSETTTHTLNGQQSEYRSGTVPVQRRQQKQPECRTHRLVGVAVAEGRGRR